MKRILKKWGSLLMAAVLVLAGSTAVQAHRQLVPLDKNVYAYIGSTDFSTKNSMAANSTVVIGEKGIAVIDTRVSDATAKELLESIREVSDKPILYAVNTHTHLDHSYGNEVFTAAGAKAVSSMKDAEIMKHADAAEQYKKFGVPESEWKGTRLSVPTITFDRHLDLDLGGGESLHLIYDGPTHTPGSIFVYLPKEKILCTGDACVVNVPFMGDSDPENWAKALDDVMALDVDKVVPGHGPLFAKKDLGTMRDYIALFDASAKKLCATENSVEDVAQKMKKILPPREGDDFIAMNIRLKYWNKGQQ